MFERTYQTELDYLYQLCEEIGRMHPRVAPVLGRDADPGVSRLVQSLAFSFARLRERIDDELPEVIHPVIETLCPSLLRAFPSSTMLELEPTLKARTRQTIEKGRRFNGPPVDGVVCSFATTEECVMQPVSLRGVEARGAERRQLRLAFELFEGVRLAEIDSLSLYFGADLAQALDLRAHLIRKTERVAILANGRELPLGDGGAFRRPGFADPHLPGRHRLGAPLMLVREYFAFANKFARLQLTGLQLAELGDARTFELEIRLTEPLPSHVAFDPTSVKLHVVPTAQLSVPRLVTTPTEPEEDRWSLRAMVPGDDTEIFSVDRVAVVERGTLRSKTVPAWADLIPPPLESTEDATLFYELHRRRSAVGPEIEVLLTFGTATRPTPPGGDLELTVVTTQLRRAARLEIGEVSEGANAANAVVAFRNVTPVTRAAPAVIEGDRLWHFYRYFKLGLPSLAERSELAALLARANMPAWCRWPGAKESATEFEALLDVRWRRTHLTGEAVARIGVELDVFVDESRFSGAGDLFLFGEVLEVLLAGAANEEDAVRLILHDRAGQPLFTYDFRQGMRAP